MVLQIKLILIKVWFLEGETVAKKSSPVTVCTGHWKSHFSPSLAQTAYSLQCGPIVLLDPRVPVGGFENYPHCSLM